MSRPRSLDLGLAITTGACLALSSCAEKTDDEFRADVARSLHAAVDEDLADLDAAARNLQASAPDRAWSSGDHQAIAAMRAAWKRVRNAWERVEGAVSPMFMDLDERMDARYETMLAPLGRRGDQNPFDDRGVIGMHAIERILYAPDIRQSVIDFESGLPGYQAAAFPASDGQAIAFKTQLVQQLIDDADALIAGWHPDDADLGAAYQGLVGVMSEQSEKIRLAVTGEEESRYANVTLFDMRNNLVGTQQVYGLFRDWIRSKAAAIDSDQQVLDRFADLRSAYEAANIAAGGDSLPAVPHGWSSSDPSAADLDSSFGKLWVQLHDSLDPGAGGSMITGMNRVAALLGFPESAAEPAQGRCPGGAERSPR